MKAMKSPPVQGCLAGNAVLSCHFSTTHTTKSTTSSPTSTATSTADHLRIKWTKLEGDEEKIVLVAQNGVIKMDRAVWDGWQCQVTQRRQEMHLSP